MVKPFLHAGSATFIVNALGTGVLFTMHIVAARILGSAEYGAFYLTLTWIAILALIGKCGIDTAIIRFFASYIVSGDWPRLKGLIGFAALTVLACGIVVGVFFAVANIFLSDRLTSTIRTSCLIGSIGVPLLALLQTSQSALIGLQQFVRGVILERLFIPVATTVLLIVILVVREAPPLAYHAVYISVGVAGAGLVASVWWLVRALPVEVYDASTQKDRRKWIATALPLALLSAIHLILNHMDTVMVGGIIDSAAAGLYGVPSRLSALVLFGLIAVNGVAAPLFSKLYSQGKRAELCQLIILTTRIGLAFSVAASIFLVFFGEWALSLFGDTFRASYSVLVIILVSQVVNAAAGPVGVLATMTGGERSAALAMVFALTVNIGLNAMLIPTFGLQGAAVGTVVSTVLWNGLLLRVVHNQLGFSPLAVLGRP